MWLILKIFQGSILRKRTHNHGFVKIRDKLYFLKSKIQYNRLGKEAFMPINSTKITNFLGIEENSNSKRK
jgi:hypothetical protein